MADEFDLRLSDASFKWDEGNAEKNWIRHGVRWSECEEVFKHAPLLVSLDRRHSRAERRFGALGRTQNGRRLTTFFTLRKGHIRVISARDMNRAEVEEFSHAEEARADPEVP
jgi:uncharacterized DUF497 family protein